VIVDNMAHPIMSRTLFSLAKLWVKEVKGLDNLKKTNPFIVACNHNSFADDLIMPAVVITYLNRYLYTYCNDGFYKNFFLRKFLENGRCIPVRVGQRNDESKKVNDNVFDMSLKLLRDKELIAIFPEGHRSSDGELQKAKVGTARLALTAKTPVVPIGIVGSYEIMPKGSKFIKFKRCSVNIGEPVFFDKYYGQENNKKVLIEVTTKIMKEIGRLSGKEYRY
jgi:1-acyl-sn-glycerol-3-phosphate acyltransferase